MAGNIENYIKNVKGKVRSLLTSLSKEVKLENKFNIKERIKNDSTHFLYY